MGFALLKGWLEHGIGGVAVVEPTPSAPLLRLAKAGKIRLVPSLSRITSKPLVCVVALKPQVLKHEAHALSGLAKDGALMISIAAGTSVAALKKVWGRRARIIRAMPNTPGAIAKGITGLFAASGTTKADRNLAAQLLSALGDTLWLAREDLIDTVTAVSGSGPAYVFLMAEALSQAGQRHGLPQAQAERIARATLVGAGALLESDKSSPAELRAQVTSPGGTTEAALKILMASNGLGPLLHRAVRAAKKRAKQLR